MDQALTSSPPLDTVSGNGSTIASSLVERIRRAIMTGELQPNTRLKLDTLREQLGANVSASPLREALSRLGAEGLVLIEDNRGYRVIPVSEKNMLEIATLRIDFELLALRNAILKGDSRWESEIIAAMYRLNKIDRADGAPSEQQDEWETAHRDFHLQLLSACDMPLLLGYCKTLHDLSDRYRRMFLTRNPYDRNVKNEHGKIAEVTIARDADAACKLLKKHIERTAENVRTALLKSAGLAGAKTS
jgi:DNA-binding GntR family transcriptional regulator